MQLASPSSRTSRFPPSTLINARLFRILADPTRLAIVELLADGERPVHELVAAIGCTQARLSSHLACLRHCRLVETERRGREVFYRLAIPRLPELIATAGTIAAPRAEHLAGCRRIGPDWV